MNLVRRVIAAALAALTLGGAGAAAAEPAMWVVKDKDSTIYLFGTVHVLRPEMKWRSAKLDKALTDATELWVEVPEISGDMAEAQKALLPMMAQLGLDPAHPLSKTLTPEEYKQLEAAAQAAGAPMQAVDMMRPWLASMTLGTAPLIKAGYDPKSGPDGIIHKLAAEQGDKVLGFETAEFQIKLFAGMSPEAQLQMLRQTLDQTNDPVVELDKMAAAWAVGDLAAMESQLVEEMRKEAPEYYQSLLNQRNENWTSQLQERLKGSGVSFVAVGAAHLLGADSVVAKLKARGVQVERY
jgi:uncharacterized protein